MPDVLIFADTVRSPELRHEIPLAIPDPFLYLERNGSRHVVIGSLELPRVRLLDGLEVHPLEEFGYDELVRSGLSRGEIRDELNARACQALGVGSAAVPSGFPLEVADSLRAGGMELAADSELFDARRRVKNEHELVGMRRAQRAAEAGMDAARELFRGGLHVDSRRGEGGDRGAVQRRSTAAPTSSSSRTVRSPRSATTPARARSQRASRS